MFNWLYAKHTGGTLVLRVEDTDRARNTEEAARARVTTLRLNCRPRDKEPRERAQVKQRREGPHVVVSLPGKARRGRPRT